jgi:hypothetical protein
MSPQDSVRSVVSVIDNATAEKVASSGVMTD